MTDLSQKFAQLEATLGGKLDTVIAELQTLNAALAGGGGFDSAAIVAAIEALQGPGPDNTIERVTNAIFGLAGPFPGRTLTDLYDLTAEGLYTQPEEPLNLRLPYLLSLRGLLSSPGATLSLYDLVENLNTATGGVPFESLELASVRGLLSAISAAVRVTNEGVIPETIPTDIGDNGNIVSSGRRYALFLPPISGINIASNNYDLTVVGSWLGWSVYIQTNDPAPRINNTADIANQWLGLSGSGTLNFNVEQQYAIKVYLRPPTATGYIWYWDLGELQAVSTASGTRYLPVTNKYADLTFINLNTNAPRCLSGTWAGWRWEITSPGPSSVYGTNALSVVTSTVSGTIPSGTTNRWVVQTTAQPQAGTYIRIIPPTPS